MQISGTEIEKLINYKRLGQTISMENRTRQEVSIRIKAGWSVLGMYREIFLDMHLPMSLKRRVFNQCILAAMTYGSQTCSLTKALAKRLDTSQRAMERKVLHVKLQDRIGNSVLRHRTRVTDIVQYLTNANGNGLDTSPEWVISSTEWQIKGVRSVGRPKRRWTNDIVGQQRTVWTRMAKDRESWRTLAESFFL